ncbi:MAG: Signal transduction histidine kinaselike protein [Streptosporangiaceae bacterium]|jgi:signal transduction histidine kinase|nr:Signal transduction histidine kinaselike protein [Streptosporangiaceae bacterium]
MPERNRSLRIRITVAAGAVAVLVCLCISAVLMIGLHDRQIGDARQRTREGAQRTMGLIRGDHLPTVLQSDRAAAIQVVDANKHVISSTEQLAGKPAMATFRPDGPLPDDRALCPPAGLKGCMTVFALDVFQQPGGTWVIYVANPIIPWYGDVTLLLFLIGVSAVVITMMAAGAFQVVGKTLAPVEAIRAELAEITATGLDRRVPVPRHQHEIKLLAETVNHTLDRLEAAYVQLRRFTSEASHDLRSPMTAMRIQVEDALMFPDDTDWPQTANAVLTGMERMQAIVTDLLTLARLDAGAPLRLESTDLAELVGGELDRHPHKVEITRSLEKGVFADCDRLKIARLVTNLIDNAERHADTQITVIVSRNGPQAVLEVADDGAGIPVELREVVFERFTRLDTSRDRDPAGTGLGLAIARQIAEAHHGTLTAEHSPRGARFVLRLTRSEPPLSR